MSWQDSKKDAQRWLDTLQLPGDLTGQTLDLREAAKLLRVVGHHREYLLEAARRKLVKRGAAAVIFE